MALFFTALLGLSVTILGYFIYTFNQDSFIRETEAVIDAKIESANLWMSLPGTRNIQEFITLSAKKPLAKHPHYFYFMDGNSKKIAGNIDMLPHHVSTISEGIIRFEMRGITVAAKIHTFPDGNRLLIARDIDALEKSYDTMQILSILTIMLMIVVIGTSFLISAFVVGRTNDIAATAQDIVQTGDLSRRIGITTGWDDLSYLAKVLNTFLERIEDLMQGIRHVSDNIAHDLRTPLTRFKNRLEELSKKEKIANDPQLQQDILSLTEESDRLLSTFNALLRIANIEKAQRHTDFSEIRWPALLQDVIEFYEPLAEEKNIHLVLSAPADMTMTGDRDLIFQAMANLLDNALKFTPENSTVTVEAANDGSVFSIIVTDSGHGVAGEEINCLFDRFYRGEKSRHTPGNGLGLSLVAAVVALHNGHVHAENIETGFRISMHFPVT